MPWTTQRGLAAPHKGQHANIRWVMTNDRKTQSFMKNGSQQKCLDKALDGNQDINKFISSIF